MGILVQGDYWVNFSITGVINEVQTLDGSRDREIAVGSL